MVVIYEYIGEAFLMHYVRSFTYVMTKYNCWCISEGVSDWREIRNRGGGTYRIGGVRDYYGFQTVCKCPFWTLLVTLVTDSNQTWAN